MSCLTRFLNAMFNNNQTSTIQEDGVNSIFVIPYAGLASSVFSKKIKSILRKYFGIDVQIVLTTFKVNNYSLLKCRTPLPLMAYIVYFSMSA